MSTPPPEGWRHPGWQPPPPEYPSPGWQPPQPPQPPRKSWQRRHPVWFTVIALAVVLVVLVVVGAALGSPGSKPTASTGSTTAPVAAATSAAAPAPAPVPSPAGTISGSCDTSLSDSLYGQNWLTASVTASNTGNIGTIVRIKVSWPLQGFAPIVKVKKVRTAAGSSAQVEFRVPVNDQQISAFQDMQLSSSNSNVCSYRATITGTFGTAS